jgi:HK97 family phage major capsid protein
MRQILSAADGRSLNPQEQTQFDSLKAEITGLEAQESRAQFLDDAERRSLGSPVGDKSLNALHREVNLLDVIRSQMEGRALSGAALESHQESERRTGRKAEGVFVPMAALEQRVQTANSDPAGGYLVGTDHRADQYIEPLRNSLLARSLGVRVLSGLTGNVTVPKHGTGCSSGWVAENTALTASDMAFGAVTMTPRHCGGLVEMSRQLIMQSSPGIESLVRSDLAFLLAQAIDSALIAGAGTNEPIGLLNTAGVQTASLSSLGWAGLVAMVAKLDLVNATPTAWMLGATPKAKLLSLVDSTGLPMKILDAGRMLNLPAYATNQLANKTGSPDKGRIILGDWSQIMLGIYSELDILVNPFAETAYSKGNVLVRAMSTVDVANRHPEAFVLADDVAL